MRILYPELVFGAIASSGVTFATIKDWQYFDIIRQFAPADCIHQIEVTIKTVDRYLTQSNSTRDTIKAAFALTNLTNDHDFASLLSVSVWFYPRLMDMERAYDHLYFLLGFSFLFYSICDMPCHDNLVTSRKVPSRRLAEQQLGSRSWQHGLCGLLHGAWEARQQTSEAFKGCHRQLRGGELCDLCEQGRDRSCFTCRTDKLKKLTNDPPWDSQTFVSRCRSPRTLDDVRSQLLPSLRPLIESVSCRVVITAVLS